MTHLYFGAPVPVCSGNIKNSPVPALSLKRILLRPIALLLALSLSACGLATGQEERKQPSETPYDAPLNQEASFIYKYLALSESLEKGDSETALQMAHEVIKLSPNPELYLQAVMILDQGNQPGEAMRLARQGAAAYPEEFSLHMIMAELLERHGKSDEALRVLDDYSRRYTSMTADERRLYMAEFTSLRQFAVFMLLDSRRFEDAYSYISAIPVSERSPTIRYYEILILRDNNENKQARKKLYDLVREYPDFTDGWLTLAQDMEKAQDYKSAVGFYQKAFDSASTQEIYLRLLLARIKAGETNAALQQVLNSPVMPELKLRAALLFMDNKAYAASKQILLTLQNDPDVADDVALYLGMIAYDTGENMPEALERLQDISQDAPNRARMLYLKTILHVQTGDYHGAYESATLMRNDYPENKDHWALLAELGIASKQYAEAEQISREALEQWPDDVPLMYSLAMSMNFQKKIDESIVIFEEILTLDDNNVMALNALGYTLAEEKRDIARALLLINQALEQQPDNIGILDSLAWAHYHKGEYAEAWKVIKKCAARGISEPVIWDHYGDIAVAVNDKKAAVTGYTRALELNPDNRAEIRKKLERLR